MINTMTVVIIVSLRVGHVTFEVSARTCCKNSNGFVFAIVAHYCVCLFLAGAEGLEPPTCGFGDRRSTN